MVQSRVESRQRCVTIIGCVHDHNCGLSTVDMHHCHTVARCRSAREFDRTIWSIPPTSSTRLLWKMSVAELPKSNSKLRARGPPYSRRRCPKKLSHLLNYNYEEINDSGTSKLIHRAEFAGNLILVWKIQRTLPHGIGISCVTTSAQQRDKPRKRDVPTRCERGRRRWTAPRWQNDADPCPLTGPRWRCPSRISAALPQTLPM